MISRHWKGTTTSADAAAYIHHLKTETFPALAKIPGFVDGSILRRTVEEGTEFLIVTTWESLEPIKAFVGNDNVDVAMVPDEVRAMMVRCDSRVVHYEIEDGKPRR